MLHDTDHLATRMVLLTQEELELLRDAALAWETQRGAHATPHRRAVWRDVVAKVNVPYPMGPAARQRRVPVETSRVSDRAPHVDRAHLGVTPAARASSLANSGRRRSDH